MPVVYSQVSIVECSDDTSPPVLNKTDSITNEYSYINLTNIPIWVLERNGLKYKVPFAVNDFQKKFIIRKKIHFNYSQLNDLAGLFAHDYDPVNQAEMAALKINFMRNLVLYRANKIALQLIVDLIIPQQELYTNQQVYVDNLDLLLTTAQGSENATHPYSTKALNERKYSRIMTNKGNAFNIELVDNDNKLSKQYGMVFNKAYRITPIKDSYRLDGIYLSNFEYKNGKHIVTQQYYPLTELEVLGLYPTEDQCLYKGDIKVVKEKELADLKHNTTINQLNHQQISHNYKLELEQAVANYTRMKNEAEIEKISYDQSRVLLERRLEEYRYQVEQDKFEHEVQLRRMKAEMEQVKHQSEMKMYSYRDNLESRKYSYDVGRYQYDQQAEEYRAQSAYQKYISERDKFEYDSRRMVLDDHYSARTHMRKDYSESLKMIPSLIAGVAGIWYIFNKLKS